MKTIIVFLISIIYFSRGNAQVLEIDLSQKTGITISIDITTKYVILVNRSKNYIYMLKWKKTQNHMPAFDISSLSSNDASLESCSDEIKEIIGRLDSENNESEIKKAVEEGRTLLSSSGSNICATFLSTAIKETESDKISIPMKLGYNQTITLTVMKLTKDSTKDSEWVYNLNTPEKTRWLVHYGLTYAPSIISKVNHFHAFADTAVASRYTITKDNDNGPKPWDNISATINFTWPFHAESRGWDGGFTAGFGISAGIELSGHAGFSLIIGENVIVGTGIAMMQKYKLLGKYREGQIIKENLSFTDIHEKVWLPEIFFTLGFRFGSNPFAKKTADTPAPTEAPEPDAN